MGYGDCEGLFQTNWQCQVWGELSSQLKHLNSKISLLVVCLDSKLCVRGKLETCKFLCLWQNMQADKKSLSLPHRCLNPH